MTQISTATDAVLPAAYEVSYSRLAASSALAGLSLALLLTCVSEAGAQSVPGLRTGSPQSLPEAVDPNLLFPLPPNPADVAAEEELPAPTGAREARALSDEVNPFARDDAPDERLAETARRNRGDQNVEFVDTPEEVADRAALPIEEPGDRFARAPAVQPVDPVQTGTVGTQEANPYAPVGLRLGTFNMFPSVEIGISASRTNSNSVSGTPPVVVESEDSGSFADISGAVLLQSDWVRHALDIDASARYQNALSGDEETDPTANIAATLRLDLAQDMTLTGFARYAYAREDTSSPAVFAITEAPGSTITEVGSSPTLQTLEGSLTLARDTGFVFGEIDGSIERDIYGDVDLSDGRSIGQGDQDNSIYGLRLRTGFQASPVFSPFVEARYAMRKFDSDVDTAGVDRNSDQYELRLGTLFDFGEKLNGEMAVGYVREELDDVSLADISGVSVNGALNWAPQRGTDVALNLSTITQTSGRSDVSGSVAYAADLTVNQQILRNFTATASLGVEHEVFTGDAADTTTYDASLAMTYWYNRYMGLVGRVGGETIVSDDPGEEETNGNVFVGLRMQR